MSTFSSFVGRAGVARLRDGSVEADAAAGACCAAAAAAAWAAAAAAGFGGFTSLDVTFAFAPRRGFRLRERDARGTTTSPPDEEDSESSIADADEE